MVDFDSWWWIPFAVLGIPGAIVLSVVMWASDGRYHATDFVELSAFLGVLSCFGFALYWFSTIL